jgi:hypothetical protein
MEEAVRWSIKVSRETDLALRTYLGARGMKKGDLSKYIEEGRTLAHPQSYSARHQGTQRQSQWERVAGHH